MISARNLLVAIGMIACALAPAHRAEAASIGIESAVYVPGTNRYIELVLTGIFETTDAVTAAQNESKYKLVDLYGGNAHTFMPTELKIMRAVVPELGWLPKERLNTVQLFLERDLPAGENDRYVLVVSGLAIGKDKISVKTTPTNVTMTLASGVLVPKWVKAKNKDESDLFFTGAISRSTDTTFYGSADIKVRYPVVERELGSRLHTIAPTFDLAASGNPTADPNALAFGLNWQFFPLNKHTGRVPVSRWENAFEHESSRNFDYRTVVWRSEWLFLPDPLRIGEEAQFWVNPTIGFAAGRIIEAPAGTSDAGGLTRLVAGATATMESPIFFGKTFTLQGDWRIRQQFQEELVGKLTLGKGSHKWTSVKAEIAFNDFVSFGATYQNGEQPPKYEPVKNSLTFALTFKAARRNKQQ